MEVGGCENGGRGRGRGWGRGRRWEKVGEGKRWEKVGGEKRGGSMTSVRTHRCVRTKGKRTLSWRREGEECGKIKRMSTREGEEMETIEGERGKSSRCGGRMGR